MNDQRPWMSTEQIKRELEPKQETVPEKPIMGQNEEIVEMNEDFDFNGFQVVRREFFAHLREPSATFDKCKFYVNAACLAKFPDSDYAQVLVNQKTKILALRPCQEQDKDAFQWCKISKGRRVPRQITCKLFFAKVFTLMGWNPSYRYKMLGRVIHSNGLYLLAFDLNATEVYQRTMNGDKVKTSRTPVFPSEWQDQFGLPYEEHKQSMQVNVFDGYAIYAIKENMQKPEVSPEPVQGVEKQNNYPSVIVVPENRMEGSVNV